MEIKRGQFVTGRKSIASAIGISEQSVRTSLNNLKSTNEITIKSTNKNSLVTIVKYDDYQDSVKKSTNKTTNKETEINQQTNQQSTTDKQSNNTISKKRKKEEVLPEVKKLRSDCKQFFLKHYLDTKETNYYWVAKDATALISLISQIGIKIKERQKKDVVSNDDLFLAFQLVITNITDSWILDNFSMTNISSKFNEIYTKLKDGRKQKSLDSNGKPISKYAPDYQNN